VGVSKATLYKYLWGAKTQKMICCKSFINRSLQQSRGILTPKCAADPEYPNLFNPYQ
jgi:hypothetical protein